MPDSEKYLDFTGLSHYDSKVKEVIQKDITNAWVASHAYAVGDYAVYNGLLYRCKTAHTSGSAFNTTEASNWDQVKLIDDIITPIGTAASSAVQTVSGTSPVNVTVSGTTRTVSLANGYGDTKNPYGAKSPNTVLAGPSSGTTSSAPSFRALVATDIPDLSTTYQTKLDTQTAYTTVGSSTKIPIITTNTLGQVTTITTADVVSANDGILTIKNASENPTSSYTFTANQAGDTDAVIDKTFVGLSNVENTGDTDTPTSGSTDKFTAGGAYTLKTQLEEQIRTQSAHYRGSFATWAAVPTAASGYRADSEGSTTPTANDYMIVEDASGYGTTYTGTWRFIYTGTWTEGTAGKANWEPAYKIDSDKSFKTINTTNTTAQTAVAAEELVGTGSINLHKVAKTGTYSDLIGKPTIPTSFNITANATDGIFDITGTGGANSVTYSLAPYSSTTATESWVGNSSNYGKFYLGTVDPLGSTRLNYNGLLAVRDLRVKDGITIPSNTIGYGIYLSSFGLQVMDSTGGLPTEYRSGRIERQIPGDVYTYTLPDATGTIALEEDFPEVTFNTSTTSDATIIRGLTVGTDTYDFYTPDSIAKATSEVLGSVKLFSDTVQTVSANAVTTTSNRTYGIQFNSSDQMVVNVPWTDTNTATAVDNILDGSNSGTAITYAPYVANSDSWASTASNAGKLYTGAYNPSATNRLNYNGYLYATQLYDNGSRVVNLADEQTISGNKNISGTFSFAQTGVANKFDISYAYIKGWMGNQQTVLLSNNGGGLYLSGITGKHDTSYGYGEIIVGNSATLTLPTTTGTLALTSDIPSVSLTQATSGSGNTAKTTTTWGLNSTSVVFESITKEQINPSFV